VEEEEDAEDAEEVGEDIDALEQVVW